MACLLVRGADGKSSTIETGERPSVSIGRSSATDVVLKDPALSRVHAELNREKHGWVLQDHRSRNGTFLNGERVISPAVVHDGDVIRLGRSTVVFEPTREIALPAFISDGHFAAQDTRVLSPAEAMASHRPEAWLEIVEEAGRLLLAHQPPEVLHAKVLDLVFQAVHPERAAVFSKREDGTLACVACRGKDLGTEVPVSRSLAQRVVEQQLSVLESDVLTGSRSDDTLGEQGVRSLMAVPLRGQREVLGFIYVDSRETAGLFGEKELRLLALLADIATTHLETARLFREQVRTEHLEREAKAAAEIQARLLPQAVPTIPGYEFEWLNVSCYEVGGDYCDCLPLASGRFGIVLADVAGKGMSAALLMAVTQATLRSHIGVGVKLDDLVARLNGAIFASAPENRYATFFFVELDPVTHDVRYLNAGHAPSPLVVRASRKLERLPASSTPVGLFAEADCPSRRLKLGPGDFIFACSDGVTDTRGPDGSLFGQERLERRLTTLAGRSAEEIRLAVEAELGAYSQGTPQPDDLTMAILCRRDTADSV